LWAVNARAKQIDYVSYSFKQIFYLKGRIGNLTQKYTHDYFF